MILFLSAVQIESSQRLAAVNRVLVNVSRLVAEGKPDEARLRLSRSQELDRLAAVVSDQGALVSSSSDILSTIREIDSVLDEYARGFYRSMRILFFLSTALVLFLLLGYAYSLAEQARQKERTAAREAAKSELLQHLEHERNRLAFELHDDIAQKAAVIRSYLQGVEGEREKVLSRYAGEVTQRIRSICDELRYPAQDADSLSERLVHLFSDFRAVTGIALSEERHGLGNWSPTEETALHVYRIIQELLTNARKHSQASEVTLKVTHSHPLLRIEYHDNGVGFRFHTGARGTGLSALNYRVTLLAGRIENPPTDRGTLLRFILRIDR
jgi:signal transduction histidine kinase